MKNILRQYPKVVKLKLTNGQIKLKSRCLVFIKDTNIQNKRSWNIYIEIYVRLLSYIKQNDLYTKNIS